VISPADDASGQSAQVQAIAAAVHTDEVRSAYAMHMASRLETSLTSSVHILG
jgi:hypothetical protein